MKRTIACILFLLATVCAFSQSLGNGFQNTRWGMSVQEVRDTMSANISVRFNVSRIENGERVLIYNSLTSGSDGRFDFTIRFIFNQDRLYRVRFSPALTDTNMERTLLNELINRYGNNFRTYSITTEQAGRVSRGFNVTEWSDTVTSISFFSSWMNDAQGRFGTPRNSYVEYLSRQIYNEIQNARRRTEDERRSNTQRNILDNL